MIEWLKDWANQIIVAIVIAIIFELIIPNGKNKKYTAKKVSNRRCCFCKSNFSLAQIHSSRMFRNRHKTQQ